jgi:hypothetical protein
VAGMFIVFLVNFSMTSLIQFLQSQATTTEKLEITWDLAPEHYLHCHPGICLDVLRKTKENLSQGVSCTGCNSKRVTAGMSYCHTNLTDTLILYERNLLSE